MPHPLGRGTVRSMSILIDADSRIIVQGITGREAVSFTRDMLDYGAKVVGGVTPGRGGRDVAGVPVFDTVRQITDRKRVDVSVLAVPAPALRDAAFEAIEAGVPLLVILTERVPRKDVVQVLELAQIRGARVVGPNSMGILVPGRCKVGPIGGPAEDAAQGLRAGAGGHHVPLRRHDDRDREPADAARPRPEHGREHGRRPDHRQHLRRADARLGGGRRDEGAGRLRRARRWAGGPARPLRAASTALDCPSSPSSPAASWRRCRGCASATRAR